MAITDEQAVLTIDQLTAMVPAEHDTSAVTYGVMLLHNEDGSWLLMPTEGVPQEQWELLLAVVHWHLPDRPPVVHHI